MKINKKWVLLEPDKTDENYQIIPLNDSRKHKEIMADCWCEPKIDFENGKRIVIHKAKDGRDGVKKVFIGKTKKIPFLRREWCGACCLYHVTFYPHGIDMRRKYLKCPKCNHRACTDDESGLIRKNGEEFYVN